MFLLVMFLTFTTNRWEDGSLIPFSTHSWCIFYMTCWKWCYAADATFLGYFDAPTPGLVTRHSGRWGLETVTLSAGSLGLPASVFLFILPSIFIGFHLFTSYETLGQWSMYS